VKFTLQYLISIQKNQEYLSINFYLNKLKRVNNFSLIINLIFYVKFFIPSEIETTYETYFTTEGNTAQISCECLKNELVTWFRNQVPLVASQRVKLHQDEESFHVTIENVQLEDQADYLAIVGNKHLVIRMVVEGFKFF